MNKDLRHQFTILAFILMVPVLILFASIYYKDAASNTSAAKNAENVGGYAVEPVSTISVNGVTFELELAVTPIEQQRGLSFRKSLPDNKVLLFVFDKADKWGIWMKDMNFPIDIFWLDKDYKVIYQQANVSPDTYPQAFVPTKPAYFVLEASAGTAARAKIGIGSQFTLSQTTE